MTRFPVIATVKEAILFLPRHTGEFAIVGAVPIILYLLASTLFEAIWGTKEPTSLSEVIYSNVAITVIEFIPVPLYVMWHRATLFGGIEADANWFPRVGKTELSYAFAFLSIQIPGLVGFMVMDFAILDGGSDAYATLSLIVGLLTLFVMLWLMIKMSFVFVDIAFNRLTSVRQSWMKTKGNVFRLAVIGSGAFLVSITLTVGVYVVPILLEFGEPETSAWLEGPTHLVLSAALSFLMICLSLILVSAASIAYRHVTGWPPIDPSLPSPQETL